MSGERNDGGLGGRGGGDHQHTPTFLCSASRLTPPLSVQQVVSESVQLVETGDAKQPVRDKRRRPRYAQHPQHSESKSKRHRCSLCSIRQQRYTLKQYALPLRMRHFWNMHLGKGAGSSCYQLPLIDTCIETDKLLCT